MDSIVTRLAAELGWSESEVRSFSLPAIRDLLPEGSKLREEVTRLIRTGEVVGALRKPVGKKR